jgi:hypothetical protein
MLGARIGSHKVETAMSDGRVARLLEEWRAGERLLRAVTLSGGEEWAIAIEEARVEAARVAYQEVMAAELRAVWSDRERAS